MGPLFLIAPVRVHTASPDPLAFSTYRCLMITTHTQQTHAVCLLRESTRRGLTPPPCPPQYKTSSICPVFDDLGLLALPLQRPSLLPSLTPPKVKYIRLQTLPFDYYDALFPPFDGCFSRC